jgi:putative transposase
VLNRAVGRQMIFKKDDDFEAFESVLAQAVERSAGRVQLLAYCVMGNHWHLVVRTTANGALSPFMKWLTLTHTQRYQVAHQHVGYGPVYQGRFKSFVIESGQHLLQVCRYVERNAARASLVERAEDWQWSSLWRWRQPNRAGGQELGEVPLILSPWPSKDVGTAVSDGSGRPRQWLRQVNTPHTPAELDAIRHAIKKSRPYGSDRWSAKVIRQYDLTSTTRDRGRPPQTD